MKKYYDVLIKAFQGDRACSYKELIEAAFAVMQALVKVLPANVEPDHAKSTMTPEEAIQCLTSLRDAEGEFGEKSVPKWVLPLVLTIVKFFIFG